MFIFIHWIDEKLIHILSDVYDIWRKDILQIINN